MPPACSTGFSRSAASAEAAREAVGEACAGAAPPVDTVLVFATGAHRDAPGMAAAARAAATGARVLGAVSSGVVAGGVEVEEGPAVVAVAFGREAPVARPFWVGPEAPPADPPAGALVLFADGSAGPPEATLARVSDGLPAGTPVVGTMAAAGRAGAPLARFLDQSIAMSRPAGLLLGRPGEVVVGVAQGCQPVGPWLAVTRAQGNVVATLDGKPAFEAFAARARPLLDDLRRAAQTLFVAVADADGHADDYSLRGLIGFDPERGLLALSAPVAAGTRLRFALRDAGAARDGLRAMLDEVKARLGGRRPRLALWLASAGRGRSLFGVPDHDAAFLADALGDVPLVGLLGGSEIAPSRAGRARLHIFSGVLVVA